MYKVLICVCLFSFISFAQERPNIVILMADDVGYSDIGCFGGEIKTPHLDSLAEGGLRFTNFYSENMCWVSRASLLTGSYHKASLNKGGIHAAAVTLPEALKPLNYKAYITGKWHLGGKAFPSPLDRGFDHFYGIPGGASSFFAPDKLTRDKTLIEEEFKDPNYYFTNAISDNAAKWIKEADKEKPVFLYVAYTAAHWPLHAFEKDIVKYRGKYAKGWDKIRKERFARMQQMNILPPNSKLSPRHSDVRAWAEAPHKDWEQRRMEVYAAQLTVMDEGIGRIIQALKDSGRFDNTLLLFTIDNGGCHVEYTKDRKGSYLPVKTRDGKEMIPGNIPGLMPGPENTYQSYGMSWANMSNTPFRYFKKYDHEGGIRTPMIAHWPAKIKGKGELVRTPAHLVDLMPTILDLNGISQPKESHGKTAMKMDGVSLKPLFLGEGKDIRRENIFFHHASGKALRKGNWKVVAVNKKKWELYNLKEDPVELDDLAESNPEKLKDMIAEWEAMSKKMKKKNSL